ncbi:carbohydrate ABC transporter permease [Paenibacillus nasutitermitis]|nr:carbohydrate ABC transporter permease [Paenibacillus nasutitermitis]
MATLKRMKAWNLPTHLILILVCTVMIYPIVWWLGASLKTNAEMSLPGIFPSDPQWSNYVKGWTAIPDYTFSRFFANSFIIELFSVTGSVVSASLVAFGFARVNFRYSKLWFALLMLTMMIPSQVIVIPQYVMFSDLNWINTYLPIIVPHFFGGGGFFVFLLVQFIRSIPRELDESAKIDGCTTFGIYFRIIMPLVKPALVTVAIYSFLWTWDDFFQQLLYINSVEKFTVGLALRLFMDSQSTVEWGQMLSMSLLSIIPSVIVFFLAQKQFIEGIATTGLKG